MKIVAFYPKNILFYQEKKNGDWRWKVKADNGRIIGSSSEGYRKKEDAMYNLASLGLTITNSQEFEGYLNEKEIANKHL